MTAGTDRVSLTAALTHTPHLTKSQWRATGLAVRFLIAIRAPVLVMTFASAALGGALAWWHGSADGIGWALCTLGLLLAHASNNLLNDLTDSLLGIDRGDYFRTRYGAHVLEHDLMSARGLLGLTALTGAAALAIGLYLCERVGPAVLWPLAAGALLRVCYTYPLKRLGLGELAVRLVWGPLMTGGAYLVTSHGWHASAAWVGGVAGLAPTAVILGKHLDKREFDAARGIRTLPVRLGAARTRATLVAILALPYACIAWLAARGDLPWSASIVLLALPDTVRAIRAFRRDAPSTRPPDYPANVWPLWYAAHAFAGARAIGILLLAGVAIAAIVHPLPR